MAQPLKRPGLLAGLMLVFACAHAGPDPMAPPARRPAAAAGKAGSPAVPPFVPAALLWTQVGTPTPYAWYDGRLVQPGDRLGEVQVIAIAEDHIVLLSHGRRHRVPLLPGHAVGAELITPPQP